jgi:type I restriction enzyme S subunit
LPPLAEQECIVRILDAAEELRCLREQADHRTADLVPALFHNVFGDPATNPKGWPVISLGALTDFVTSGSRGWAKYYAHSGARFIRVQDLNGHRLNSTDPAFVRPPESSETARTRIRANDLLLTITGVVGLVAAVPAGFGEGFVSQHVAIARLKATVDPVFVATFLSLPSGGQRQMAELQYGQTKPGLNLDQIRAVRMYSPPLSLQRAFAARVAEIRAMEERQAESRRRLDDLFQSLLHRAFQGGL